MQVYYDKDAELAIIKGKKVAVIGGGNMGGGIAAQFANAGVAVELLDVPGAGPSRNEPAQLGLQRQKSANAFMVESAVEQVRTGNTVGLLAEMSRVFSHHGVNIKQANCRAYGDGERAINTFHAQVASLDQLQSLLTALRSTEGVLAVQRVFNPGSGTYPRP